MTSPGQEGWSKEYYDWLESLKEWTPREGMSLEAVFVKEDPECVATEPVIIKTEADWNSEAVCQKQESPHASADTGESGHKFLYEVPLEPECVLRDAPVLHDAPRPSAAARRRPPAREGNTNTNTLPLTATATSRREYVCDACGKTYKWRRYLIQHIKVAHLHQTSYACDICKKEFSQSGNLKRHGLVHTGEKPYSCDICNRNFAELSNLKVHRRIHTGIKPYCCEICKKEFGHVSHFNSHKRVHTGQKLSCDICHCKFSRLSYLNVHKRVHTGEKPYTCERCKESFSQSRYLKKHQCTQARN